MIYTLRQHGFVVDLKSFIMLKFWRSGFKSPHKNTKSLSLSNSYYCFENYLSTLWFNKHLWEIYKYIQFCYYCSWSITMILDSECMKAIELLLCLWRKLSYIVTVGISKAERWAFFAKQENAGKLQHGPQFAGVVDAEEVSGTWSS